MREPYEIVVHIVDEFDKVFTLTLADVIIIIIIIIMILLFIIKKKKKNKYQIVKADNFSTIEVNAICHSGEGSYLGQWTQVCN